MTLIVALIAIAPLTGLLATFYVLAIYRSDPDRPRSVVFRLLVLAAVAVEIQAVLIEPAALAVVLGVEPPSWGSLAVGLGVLVGLTIPHMLAAHLWLLRRRRR